MKIATTFLIFAFPVAATAAGGFLVAPNHLLDNEGNSSDWPFTFTDGGITSRRYQQVYEASQFAAMGPEGAYIQGVWFREDMLKGGGRQQIAWDFLDSVQISLGITARSADSLSPSFDENIGPVYTTVFGPSPLEVSTALSGWESISLSQPFLYVPSMGNLLIDIRTTDDSPFPFARRRLDAEDTLGDSVSAVIANDVNAISGFLTTKGLVTGFAFVPIPEPSTWALLGLGLFGIWRFTRSRGFFRNSRK